MTLNGLVCPFGCSHTVPQGTRTNGGIVLRTPRFDWSGIHSVAGLPSSPPGGPMDAKLSAVPLVAVRDREAHHPGTRFEVRHASAQPMVDRAGTDVEAPSELPLADPSAAWGITWMSWVAGQGGLRGMPQLAKRDGNQGRIESRGFFHFGRFNGFLSRFVAPVGGEVGARGSGRCRRW